MLSAVFLAHKSVEYQQMFDPGLYVQEPFLITLIPQWISNYIQCEVWDEITQPPLKFGNESNFTSNFTPHFTGQMITIHAGIRIK